MATRRGRRLSMEDRAGAWDVFCEKTEDVVHATPDFSIWAVFDGHGSSAVSSYLLAALYTRLQQRLCTATTDSGDVGHRHRSAADPPSDKDLPTVRHQAVRTALLLAFDDVDSELRNGTAAATATALTQALSGDSAAALGAGRPEPGAAAADASLAAAVAAAWDSGSTAVVAVADWGADCGRTAQQHTRGANPAAACAAAAGVSIADGLCNGSQRFSEHAAGSCSAYGACSGGSEEGPEKNVDLQRLRRDPPASEAGAATATACTGELWVASVGNSRAVLCAKGDATAGAPSAAPARAPASSGAAGRSAGDAGASGVRSRRRAAAAAAAAQSGQAGGSAQVAGRNLLAYSLSAIHELHDEGERRRVEAAGGRVEQPVRPGGKPRLMGDLEVSRALGDLQYRPVGLSAVPDVAGPWLLSAGAVPATACGPDGWESHAGDGGPGCSELPKAGASSGGSNRSCEGCDMDPTGSKDRGGADGNSSSSGGGGVFGCVCGASESRAGAHWQRGGQDPRHSSSSSSSSSSSWDQVAVLLVLASDGVMDVMEPQEVCDHAAAQLSGAADPPLTPEPPPAIALGPVSQEATPGTQTDQVPGEAGAVPVQVPSGRAAAGHTGQTGPAVPACPGGESETGPVRARREGSPASDGRAGGARGVEVDGAAAGDREQEQSRQQDETRDVGSGATGDGAARALGDGLPGCCDCDLVPRRGAGGEAGGGTDPCASQAFHQRTYRRPAYRTAGFAAERLVQEAFNRGSMDNLAAMVVQLPASQVQWTDNAVGPHTAPSSSKAAPNNSATSNHTCLDADIQAMEQPIHDSRTAWKPPQEPMPGSAGTTPVAITVGATPRSIATNAAAAVQPSGQTGSDSTAVRAVGDEAGGGRGLGSTSATVAAGETAPALLAAVTGADQTASIVAAVVGNNDAAGGKAGPLVPWRWDPSAAGALWPLTGVPALRRCSSRHQPQVGAVATTASRDLTATRHPAAPLTPHPGAGSVIESPGGDSGFAAAAHDSTPLFGAGVPAGGGLAVRLLRLLRGGLRAACRRMWGRSSAAGVGDVGGGRSQSADTADRPVPVASAAHPSGCGGSGSGEPACTGGVILMCPGPLPRPAHDGGGEEEGGSGEEYDMYDGGHGYMLGERIVALPSAPYHLHSPTPGGDALPPWQLSDFAGASYFMVPGLASGTAGWLIDSLHSYYTRPYESYDSLEGLPSSGPSTDGLVEVDGTQSGNSAAGGIDPITWRRGTAVTSVKADVTVRQPASSSAGADGGGGADDEAARGLVSYGSSTHSLLLEIGSVPLQLALSDGPGPPSSRAAAATCSCAADTGTSGSSSCVRRGSEERDGGGEREEKPPTFLIGGRDEAGDAAAAEAWAQPPNLHRRRQQGPQRPEDPRGQGHDGLSWQGQGSGEREELLPPQLSLGPAADDSWLSGALLLGVSGGRRARYLLWDSEAEGSGHDDDPEGPGSSGTGSGREPALPRVDDQPVVSRKGNVGPDVVVDAPVVTLLGPGGGDGKAAAGAGTQATAPTAVVGGIQLQAQTRAHGVRQADGSVHLVPAQGTAGGSDVNFSGDRDGRRGGAAALDDAAAAPAAAAGAPVNALAREYRLRERFGQGHFGEVWRAWRLDRGPLVVGSAGAATRTGERPGTPSAGGAQDPRRGKEADAAAGSIGGAGSAGSPAGGRAAGYVLKRLRGDGGAGVLLSGLREAYFGDLLRRLRDAEAARRGGTDGEGGGPPGGAEGASGGAPWGKAAGRRDGPAAHDHLVDFVESFEVLPEVDPSAAHAAAATSPDSRRTFGAAAGTGTGGGDGAGADPAEPEGEAAEAPPPDLWLVFGDAGQSLHDLIYSPVGLWTLQQEGEDEDDGDAGAGGRGAAGGGDDAGGGGGPGASFQVLGPSPWWTAMRRHPRGNDFVRELLRQLLTGLQVVHEANITHRDVKPENMMLSAVRLPGSAPTRTSTRTANSRSGSRAAARQPGPGRRGVDDLAGPLPPTTSTDSSFAEGARANGGEETAPPRPPAAEGAAGVSGGAQSAWQRLSGWSWRGGGAAPASAAPSSSIEEMGGGATSSGAGSGDAGDAGGGPGRMSASGQVEEDDDSKGRAEEDDGAAHAGPEEGADGAVAPVWVRLIDFGSAVDGYSLQHLYGDEGPTSDQLTLEYAPPEALFGRYWEGMRAMRPRAWGYDIWSVGVVWLELLMATPQVWQLPAATRALLEVRLALRGRPESERHMVFLLRGLMEWCIYPPQAPSTAPHGPPLRGRKSRLLMSWSCTEEALLALARSRDPLGLGLEGPMALRLLMRLLHWDPASRPSARQALQHAYFTVSPADWPAHACGGLAEGEPGWC